MKVVAIDVPELGNRSYIVHDGKTALVVDPSRRSHEFIQKANDLGVDIGAIFETHIHNDYVTGGYALAKKLNVPYYVSAQDKVSFMHEEIMPEQTVGVGEMSITALASPGHTFNHTSFVVEHADETPVLFSGGSLLYGAVGRPDLVSAEATIPLAKAQYETAQFYAERLKPETLLYPTHGFGSFCAATKTESVSVSTLAEQFKTNHAYTSDDQDSFIKELIAGLDAYPSYYSYMAPANLKGPLDPNLAAPAELTKEAIMRALHEGAAIIDMRSRTAYAREHMPGTYNIELSNSLATYVGWLIAWESQLILVAKSKEEVAMAQEQLSLIGREIISGQVRSADLLRSIDKPASYPVRSYADFATENEKGDVNVLDIRRKAEWKEGHLKGSINIPLHELSDRLGEVDNDAEVWVHCGSGFRASIAASILSSSGKRPVLIDDDFERAAQEDLIIVKEKI